jgi:hypothetical protein
VDIDRRTVIRGATGAAALATYSDWDSSYGAAAYDSDFAEVDDIGKDAAWRVDAYNPLYHLSPAFAGYRRSQVAPHWRIRSVDFATVWAMAHTQAEYDNGDPTTNFIDWVESIVGK